MASPTNSPKARARHELAPKVGADLGVLRRVLRGLAAEEVLEELPGGRFGLTTTGQLLREGGWTCTC